MTRLTGAEIEDVRRGEVELAAGARIGSGLVAKLEQRVAQLRRLDDFVGGRDLQVLVEQELQLTAGVLRNATYNDRLGRRLLAAIGELCWLAGWVAVDAGDNRQALRRYSAGIRAAHAADDRQGAANLISSVAYLLTNQGRFDEAITASRTALAGADRGGVTSTVRALLGERLAWAHANVGNVAHTERALDQVDLDFDRRDTEQDPDWIYWLDRDEIDVMAARCMDRLGDPNKAIDLLSDILHRYHPDKTRERALHTATLAEAHLHAGDVDQAGMTALQVAQLAGTTSSTRSDDRVHGLVQLLEPMGSVATVRDFLDSARQSRESPGI